MAASVGKFAIRATDGHRAVLTPLATGEKRERAFDKLGKVGRHWFELTPALWEACQRVSLLSGKADALKLTLSPGWRKGIVAVEVRGSSHEGCAKETTEVPGYVCLTDERRHVVLSWRYLLPSFGLAGLRLYFSHEREQTTVIRLKDDSFRVLIMPMSDGMSEFPDPEAEERGAPPEPEKAEEPEAVVPPAGQPACFAAGTLVRYRGLSGVGTVMEGATGTVDDVVGRVRVQWPGGVRWCAAKNLEPATA